MICPDCFGHRSYAGLDLVRCTQADCLDHPNGCWRCHNQPGPCELHTCKTCQGTGLVCPQCRGDRRVRIAAWDTRDPQRESVKCDACCEGNQVNPAKESKAIERWIRKHVPDAAQTQLEVVK